MITGIIGAVLIIGAGLVLAGSCISAETYLANQEICGSNEFTVFNN